MTQHLCHVFASFALGGPEVRVAELASKPSQPYRHTIVSLDGGTTGAIRLREGAPVRLLAGPPRRSSATYPFALARQLRRIRPDLVLTYGWGGTDALLGARMAGLRAIHAEHGFLCDEAAGERRKRLVARRVFFRLSPVLVVPSSSLAAHAVQVWKVPPSRVRHLPNGVDTDVFRPPTAAERAAARHRLGLRDEDVVIGSVGTLRPVKNHRRLIRLVASLGDRPELRLVLAGDGPLLEHLQGFAAAVGVADRVAFLGGVADVAGCLHALDLYAATSDSEQMPTAVLEAMSCGLAVVSTDVGDVRHMVSEPNRRYVQGSDDGLRAAIEELLGDADARARIGVANRAACVDRYSSAAMTERYLRLYRDALG